jgi:hypothetical protein
MSGRLVGVLAGLTGALALSLVFAVSCASRGDEDGAGDRPVTKLPQPGPELSQELMLGLALAKNYHHKADVYLKEARVEQAVEAVRQILTIQFPAGSPEGEDVVLDARARLAKLLVTRGELDQAMTAQVEDRDKAAATAARREAIESYDRAITIEKALIDQLAGEGVE